MDNIDLSGLFAIAADEILYSDETIITPQVAEKIIPKRFRGGNNLFKQTYAEYNPEIIETFRRACIHSGYNIFPVNVSSVQIMLEAEIVADRLENLKGQSEERRKRLGDLCGALSNEYFCIALNKYIARQ